MQSEVAVLFEGTYNIIKDSIGQTKVKHAIVVSAGESLPFGVRQLYFLKTPRAGLPKSSVFQSWKDFLAAGANTAAPSVQKDPRTMALISHTGGTTGEPKGVMCSDYGCNALMYQLLCNFEFSRQECSLNVLPPFINYSLLESIMAMLSVGFKVILIPKYDPLGFADYIRKYKPNQVLSIPAYWEALLRIKNIEKVDMSCLKHIYSGGEKMDARVEVDLNRVLKKCGVKTNLYNCMGSTEMMAGATILYDNCYKKDSVGIPMVKVGCKIVQPESDNELNYGSVGEICFSGSTLMLGYYNNQPATDAIIRIHADGQRWLHTGDLGYMDKDGALYITGRIKRILMTRGKDGHITKIFPDRIEKTLATHPAVELCCVIGIPDEERINYPKAFIVTKAGVTGDDALTEELLCLCRDKLPAYMVPEEIEYRADLPRTPRGKLDYRELERENRS